MYKASWGQKRICPCNKIRYYDLGREKLECPECGHILRNSRWKDAWKWILGSVILFFIGTGGFMILFFGNIPTCDDPHTLQRLRGEFDHTLYATTLKLVSESVMSYGPREGMLLFQNRNCRIYRKLSKKL